MTEFSPVGSTPRMTKAQMRKYLADAKVIRKAAKEKLPDEEQLEKERLKEMKKVEQKFDDVF